MTWITIADNNSGASYFPVSVPQASSKARSDAMKSLTLLLSHLAYRMSVDFLLRASKKSEVNLLISVSAA